MKETIEERKITTVNVNSLTAHPHNPPERTEENVALNNLRNAIRKHGVVEPIHYCGDRGVILNGHRRWICCKQLNIETVDGFAYYGLSDEEFGELFLMLNTTSRKFSPAEELYTYLNGGVVSKNTRSSIKTLEYVGGAGDADPKRFLTLIRKSRKSPTTYSSGLSMFSNWTKKRTRAWRHSCLVWMTSIGNPWQLKYAIDEGADPDVILDAIAKSLPLRKDWGTIEKVRSSSNLKIV